ncbi:YxlC family protein [Paenibacillus sp. RRE4]|uniref:YxlC family protein n=1 Tax=Paenibacillus TaxID=44249 RepID=UPI0011A65828|nr:MULTISPECIES: YxlC family protein [Paenibacillus]MDT0125921.1 YxlC family protein [Paenibacillus sp. RRE4]
MSRLNESQDKEIVQRLQQSMKALDDVCEPADIPSLATLESRVREQRRIKRRANLVEIICFWFVALTIITLGTLLFVSSPAVYLGIQVLGTVIAVSVAVVSLVRHRKETMHHE